MGYWSDMKSGVETTLKGMKITFGAMFEPTFTMQYPEERKEMPDAERGIHEYDVERCIACDNCAKACPVSCIYIDSEGKGKAAKLTRFEIDYQKCLFCNLCVPPCPVDCIKMGKDFDISGYAREDMIIPFHLGVRPIKEHTALAKEDIEKRRAEAAAPPAPKPAPPAPKPADPAPGA